MSKIKLNRAVELAIGTALIVVLVYIVSIAVKVSSGVSKTLDTPPHQIRLQVLNGCGVPGAANKLADKLAGFADADIEIMVVDTDNFDLAEVPGTFLISREGDKESALLLAERLGLDKDQVEYKPLENNYRHVSVSLVLGADYEDIELTKKEN